MLLKISMLKHTRFLFIILSISSLSHADSNKANQPQTGQIERIYPVSGKNNSVANKNAFFEDEGNHKASVFDGNVQAFQKSTDCFKENRQPFNETDPWYRPSSRK